MSSGLKPDLDFLCPGIEPGQPRWKNRNPSHQTSKGWEAQSCFLPGSLTPTPVKNAVIVEAESQCGCNVDSLKQQQVGDHKQSSSFSFRARQRGTRPERKGVGVCPHEPECTEVVKPCIYRGQFFRVFVFLPAKYLVCLPSGQVSGFSVHTRPTLGPSPGCPRISQPRWILQWRLLGGTRLIMGWPWPLTFDPQGAFPHVCSLSFVPKEGRGARRSLNPLLRQRFASLCLCPWFLPWGVCKRQRLAISPAYVVTSISKGPLGG